MATRNHHHLWGEIDYVVYDFKQWLDAATLPDDDNTLLEVSLSELASEIERQLDDYTTHCETDELECPDGFGDLDSYVRYRGGASAAAGPGIELFCTCSLDRHSVVDAVAQFPRAVHLALMRAILGAFERASDAVIAEFECLQSLLAAFWPSREDGDEAGRRKNAFLEVDALEYLRDFLSRAGRRAGPRWLYFKMGGDNPMLREAVEAENSLLDQLVALHLCTRSAEFCPSWRHVSGYGRRYSSFLDMDRIMRRVFAMFPAAKAAFDDGILARPDAPDDLVQAVWGWLNYHAFEDEPVIDHRFVKIFGLKTVVRNLVTSLRIYNPTFRALALALNLVPLLAVCSETLVEQNILSHSIGNGSVAIKLYSLGFWMPPFTSPPSVDRLNYFWSHEYISRRLMVSPQLPRVDILKWLGLLKSQEVNACRALYPINEVVHPANIMAELAVCAILLCDIDECRRTSCGGGGPSLDPCEAADYGARMGELFQKLVLVSPSFALGAASLDGAPSDGAPSSAADGAGCQKPVAPAVCDHVAQVLAQQARGALAADEIRALCPAVLEWLPGLRNEGIQFLDLPPETV